MSRTRDSSPAGSHQRFAVRKLSLPIGDFTLEAHGSLDSAENDWRAFEPSAQGHPYQAFDWLAAWDACIRTAGSHPFVVVVREGGAIRMLLPFVLERRVGLSRLVPMGIPVCDYHAPLVEPGFAGRLDGEAANCLLDAIVAFAQADYLLLTHVPPWLGAVRNPFAAARLQSFSADSHAVRLGADWKSFYAERRGAKTRGRLRTKEKGLARAGTIEFSEVTEPHARAALAAEVMAIKAARLASRAGAFNAFTRPGMLEFFVSLGREQAGLVRFFQLAVGGKVVAVVIGLVRQGCFYYQVPVCAEGPLERFSPGHVLVTRLLEWAISQGCSRFDFTIGDEAYKAEWCDESWTLGCMFRARTMAGWAGARVAMALIAAERIVKRRPAFYAQAIRMRAALHGLRALGTKLLDRHDHVPAGREAAEVAERNRL